MTAIALASLRTARLTLRASGSADFGGAFEIRSNWNVARNLSAASFPPDPAYMAAWFDGHESEWRAGTAYRFAIIHRELMIGIIDINDVENCQGELGYWLDESVWGQGFGYEAGEAVVRFAFVDMGLEALVAGHAADNFASGRVLQKLGFVSTGETTIFSTPRNAEIVQRRLRLTAERYGQLQTVR